MSRVSEALKRAVAQDNRAQTPPPHSPAHEAETPFVSAWDLERLPPDRGPEVGPHADHGVPDPLTALSTGEGPSARTGGEGDAAPSVRLGFQLEMKWPQPFAAEVSEKLVVMRATKAAAAEQYRRLEAALLQAQVERRVKIVMVASAIPGEGKTLTAANLALTLSQSNRWRVLLIDTDLRRPRIHELFQVSAGSGLKGYLSSTTGHGMPVVELTPSLTLLPAGRPEADPGGVLGSGRMRKMLTEASASFDWVILDTAPAVLLPDARLLAPLVDVAILVIEAGKTPRKLIERAVEALGRDRLLGVVLNRAADSAVAAARRELRPPGAVRWIR